jgi:hypothetical protein
LEISDVLPALPNASRLQVQQENRITPSGRTVIQRISIDTGVSHFQIRNGGLFPFDSVDFPDSHRTRRVLTMCSVQNQFGNNHDPFIHSVEAHELGPLRASLHIHGYLFGDPYYKTTFADFDAYLHFFADSPSVRFFFTIRNPKWAKHPRGIWPLGDKGSTYFKEAWFALKLSEFHVRIDQLDGEIDAIANGKDYKEFIRLVRLGKRRDAYSHARNIDWDKFGLLTAERSDLSYKDRDMAREWNSRAEFRCSPELGVPFTDCKELNQDSSGGSNWQSSNHVNRHGVVANSFRGYRLRTGDMLSPPSTITEKPQDQSGGESMAPDEAARLLQSSRAAGDHGQRATPIVTLEREGQSIGIAMRHFWQNFPKAIEAGPQSLTLRLFPRHHADLHELQGGEQKTHEFVVAFGKDQVTADAPLELVRSPLRVRVDPAWYAASGAVPYLTPEAEDPNADYIKLVRAAIEGEDTFEKKREVIDEYGWRNFGDIYADHEAVFHKGSQPLVSHYNNQYDPLAGFAIQFMRSGDWRWWDAMNELAAHVVDIDIYHTDQGKSAYNHGLFWHTVHYTDAGLSTHRSYPHAPGIRGGGPGNEHNYTTGLMLHYFLTGNPQSREAAIGLAQWVIDMDDGSKTIFRWLDRGYTGLASATVSPDFHGPGRGAGNSVNALLDGHRLSTGSGDPRRAQVFLDKAEQLIRRCIHPADDIAARNLLDTERRWSYTVFLQALGKYLDYKAERDELDWMYAYGRAALLHYARWMAEHEYPFLHKPKILEYPTETWVAQDMRKSEVFKFAAKHATAEERARFLERSEFFFRYVTTTLMGMKTRTLARPVVIMLSNGYMHAYFQKHPDVAAPPPQVNPTDFGKPEVFVPQKVRAKRRLLILSALMAIVVFLFILFFLP